MPLRRHGFLDARRGRPAGRYVSVALVGVGIDFASSRRPAASSRRFSVRRFRPTQPIKARTITATTTMRMIHHNVLTRVALPGAANTETNRHPPDEGCAAVPGAG